MVTFKIISKLDPNVLSYKLSEALVGSPGFINNEILVSGPDGNGRITMIIGEENENDFFAAVMIN